ncbi:MAG: hypothetical protein Q9210_000960, partial [Variospora velana]
MASRVVLATIVIWAVAFFFALLFIYGTDFSAYWISIEVEKERCVDTNILHNAFAISDFLTDLVIILLPLPMIWRLHLTVRRKLGLCAVFGLGALSVGTSIVRMVVFLQATSGMHMLLFPPLLLPFIEAKDHHLHLAQFNPNADFEFVCTAGLYWSMIESGLGLCAACLPVYYGLVRSKG